MNHSKFLADNGHMLQASDHIRRTLVSEAQQHGLQPEALIIFACLDYLAMQDEAPSYLRYIEHLFRDGT